MKKLCWDVSVYFALAIIAGALIGGGVLTMTNPVMDARKKTKRHDRPMPTVVMEEWR